MLLVQIKGAIISFMNMKKLFGAFFLCLFSFALFAQKVTEVKTDQNFLADYVSKKWTTEDNYNCYAG